jgi:hypothetical protein
MAGGDRFYDDLPAEAGSEPLYDNKPVVSVRADLAAYGEEHAIYDNRPAVSQGTVCMTVVLFVSECVCASQSHFYCILYIRSICQPKLWRAGCHLRQPLWTTPCSFRMLHTLT